MAREISEEDIGLAVFKKGYASGLTEGEVYEVDTDVTLQHGLLTLKYESVIAVMPAGDHPFSRPGDSGSVVRDQDNQVVALVVGMEAPDGSDVPLTYCTPIVPALEALAVSL